MLNRINVFVLVASCTYLLKDSCIFELQFYQGRYKGFLSVGYSHRIRSYALQALLQDGNSSQERYWIGDHFVPVFDGHFARLE